VIAEMVAAHPAVSVRQRCTLLGVHRAGYDARPAAVALDDRDATALRDAIERMVLACPGDRYRRVTRQLPRDGWTVDPKRVLRVMREEALLGQLNRRFVPTTDSAHGWRTDPHLGNGMRFGAPDQAWVADLTSIRLPPVCVDLAALLDACSRRCVGWALARRSDRALTLAALALALTTRQPAPGLSPHSDRGVPYASGDDVARREGAGAQIRMAARGNPYEHAQAERFFTTRKHAAVSLKEYRRFEDAEANRERFIADVDTTKRFHSRLGYLPPAECEAAWVMAGKG